jgi:hypothetical protein
MRILTTVDSDRLATCRRLLQTNDSTQIARALAAQIDELETEAEQRALAAFPYEEDPDLAWQAPSSPSAGSCSKRA